MPQELHILRCFSCETFQVDIVKKIPKWCCKICGEKQSVKKIYGKGTGKECRLLVQKLNEERLTKKTSQLQRDENWQGAPPELLSVPNVVKKSKWGEFIQNKTNVEEELNEDNSEREANIFNEDADIQANKKRKLAELDNSISPKLLDNNSEQTDADFKVNRQSKWSNFIANNTKKSVTREKKAENDSRKEVDNIFEEDADFDSFLLV